MKQSSALMKYFQDIYDGVKSTLKGMRVTITYFFKPSVTLRYPEERPIIPESHRGLHHYIEERCNLCCQCQAACPVNCLVVEGLGKGKEVMITRYEIDYSRCIFCNLCCEACKSECIYMGKDYDMAADSRENCVRQFTRSKSTEEREKFNELLRKKEEEKKAKAALLKAEKERATTEKGET